MSTAAKQASERQPPGLPDMWRAARKPPADVATSFAGKAVLVTGGNTGLGFNAALKFARLGASPLILVVRSLDKGNAAREAIVQQTRCSADNIVTLQADMASFSSVAALAATVNKSYRSLNVALLNAGVAAPAYSQSQDGWEMSLQVNLLSTTLLAALLLPKLRETAAESGSTTSLEFTGSVASLSVKADLLDKLHGCSSVLEELNQKENFDVAAQYGVSKLLLLYASEALARAADGQNVAVVYSCPGMCKSELGRDFPWAMKAFMGVFQGIFARSSEEGSRTLVSGAALGADANGKFWTNDSFLDTAGFVAASSRDALSDKAWVDILRVLDGAKPGVAASLGA